MNEKDTPAGTIDEHGVQTLKVKTINYSTKESRDNTLKITKEDVYKSDLERIYTILEQIKKDAYVRRSEIIGFSTVFAEGKVGDLIR